MSRLVDPKPRGARAFSGEAPDVKDYLDRVAKYVPAEILAAYLTLLPIILGTTRDAPRLRIVLLIITLLGLGILIVPYLRVMAPPDYPRNGKRKHLVISIVAYLAWTYSIGGIWHEVGWYHEAVAAILIVFISLGSGLVIPYEE